MQTVKLKLFCFSILICALVLNILISVSTAQTISGIERFQVGIDNYENGKYEDAIFNLEMAMNQMPEEDKEDLWNVHFYLGLSYLLLGDAEEATKEFSKSQEIIKNKLPDSHIHSPKIVKLFKESQLPKLGEVWQDPVTGMEFVFVKGGCFDMGDTFGVGHEDEKPVHEVCLDGFYIGKYEVTNAEFERFISETGYVTTAEKSGTGWGASGSGKEDIVRKKGINWKHPLWPSDTMKNKMSHPVVQISWDDTQEYIKWLNKKTGKEYHLPTEAEWEYAARSGGKNERFAGFSDESKLYKYANFCDTNCRYEEEETKGQNDGYKYTSPVGSYRPNGLGIYDMSGNVSDWCQDWYGINYYRNRSKNNPKGPLSGSYRVVRGGGWGDGLWGLRASVRQGCYPGLRCPTLGFRLARIP